MPRRPIIRLAPIRPRRITHQALMLLKRASTLQQVPTRLVIRLAPIPPRLTIRPARMLPKRTSTHQRRIAIPAPTPL